MFRSFILIACLGFFLANAVADSDVYYRLDDDPDEVLVKNKMYFHAWDLTDSKSWLTKGRLFDISIGAHTRVGYYYYVGKNKNTRFITDGSFQSAVRIFEEEGLAQLKADTIREIVGGFLFRMMVNADMNDIVSKSYYSGYEKAVHSPRSPLPESDFLLLQKLIGKDADNPIFVQTDKSTGRWIARFFVVTGTGQIESWKFTGVNDKIRFTVDALDRKLLGVKIKRREMTG